MDNQKQVQLQATPEVVKGVYSNIMQVQHTKEEFVLDFMNIFPPMGALTARVVLSPGHLKRMIRVLEENLKKYETSFGGIQEAQTPENPGMGFHIQN